MKGGGGVSPLGPFPKSTPLWLCRGPDISGVVVLPRSWAVICLVCLLLVVVYPPLSSAGLALLGLLGLTALN